MVSFIFKYSFDNKDSLGNIINESKGNGSLPFLKDFIIFFYF